MKRLIIFLVVLCLSLFTAHLGKHTDYIAKEELILGTQGDQLHLPGEQQFYY